jgi:IclR family pca regulon transcriptional regulator
MLLAASPERELVARLKGVKLKRRGPAPNTGHHALIAALGRVRSEGYALAIDEMEDGTLSVAVSIREHHGRIIAAMSLASHRSRMTPADLTGTVLAELRMAASRIEPPVADFQDRNWAVF